MWNYRVIEKKNDPFVKSNEYTYSVVEVYYDENGEIASWCDCAETILVWDNYSDLKGSAESVLEAFQKPVLIVREDDRLEEKSQ